jgi:hypothetical protein
MQHLEEGALIVSIYSKESIGEVQGLENDLFFDVGRGFKKLHCLVFVGLVVKYAKLVDWVHAEVDLFVENEHQHKAAIRFPVDQMGVVLAQIQVFKANKLVLILLEEILV